MEDRHGMMRPSATPQDRDVGFPSAMVVSASAGSGKTYSLAMRFAQFLLSPRVPHRSLPGVLAMTFTNAAAEEMRRRIIRFLKEAVVATPEESRDLRLLHSLVSLSPEETRRQADALLDAMFLRYDEFQVRTIDSFMARAFKASALEAGILPDFDLVRQQRPLIERAFERYARNAARDQSMLDELRTLAELAGEGAHRTTFDWNPFTRIVEGSADILRQLASRPWTLDPIDPTIARDSVVASLRSTAEEILGLEHRAGGGLRKVVRDDLERIRRGDWHKALRQRPSEGPFLKSARKNPPDSAGKDIEVLFETFNDLREQLAVADAACYYWPFVRALSAVSTAIQETKLAESKFSVDDVNRFLWQSLVGGGAPSIYITLGTRLYHYLVDEFQDTSPIQWAALKVLVENACAEDGTFYGVGDTKQSIYSFRGADWQIMQGLLHGTERVNGQQCLTATLDTNFRSDGAIVRFVETVFQTVLQTPDYGPAARLSGLERCAQATVKGRETQGYVEVLRVPKDPAARPEAEAILRLIASARARNHPLGSVAVLAQTNSQVLDIGGWLNRAGIDFLSYSNLDLRRRPVIMEILSLLAWLNSPVDDLAFGTFLLGHLFARCVEQKLSRALEGEMRPFILENRGKNGGVLYTAFRSRYPDVWEFCFSRLLAHVGFLPGYDIVCEIYKTFDIFTLEKREESALAGFLDAVTSLEAGGSTSLKDLLTFAAAEDGEEEEDVWDLASQKRPDAVTVMTVHKAKGLQFPVLIALLSESRDHARSMKLVEDHGTARLLHVTKASAAWSRALQDRYDGDLALERADTLNRLYVALTRAVHELYVVLIEGEDPAFPSTVIPDVGNPADRPQRVPEKRESRDMRALVPYAHTRSTPEPEGRGERIGFAETQRGDLVHRILSRLIRFENDPRAEIGSLMSQEVLSGPERDRLVGVLGEFLSAPQIRPLFTQSAGTDVLVEKEFLSRVGTLHRMDRVHVSAVEVTVIDFKTGGEEELPAHREQIRGYLEILRDIFPERKLKGIIAYVDRRALVEVLPSGPGEDAQ
jgi:ATP-dependent helicase/nuclease subunit A